MPDSPSDSTAEGTVPCSWVADCAEAVADGAQLRLEIYARSPEPEFGTRAYRERVMARVRELVGEGTVADYQFLVWGDRLRIGGTDREAEKLAEFRTWAREHGTSLPFRIRKCSSSIIDEEYAVLVPPHVFLALYRGDDLVGVVPCSEGDRSTSVLDVLGLLCDRELRDDQRASAST